MSKIGFDKIPVPIYHSDYHYKNSNDVCKLVPAIKDTTSHTHVDFYEFSLIISGSFCNEYNGETHILKKNKLIFFGCGESHTILINEPKSSHLSFIVAKDYFDELCKKYHPQHPELTSVKYAECHLTKEDTAYLCSILDRIMHAKEERSELFRLFIHNALFHIFFDKQETDAITSSNDIGQYIDDLIIKFDSFQNLDVPIADIYNQYPVCRAALINYFKKQTGQTIVEYRNCKRMECSARLLSSQNLSIAEVATQVGISSLSYFSKKFYEHFGVLPSEYSHQYYFHNISTEK